MAATPICNKNGAVSLPSGFGMDSQAFTVRESQSTEDITPYGANVYSRNLGAGTPTMVVTASGWARKGAAGSSPGFGAMGGTNGDVGASATFTFDTGCSLSGTFLVRDLSVGHSRIKAGAPVTIELLNGGDITTTWAVA